MNNSSAVVVIFKGDTTQYDAALSKVQKSFNATGDNIEKASSKTSKAATATMSGAATVISNAFSNVLANGVTKTFGVIKDSIGSAVSRVDTLNNFPKVMSNFGVSASDASKMIKELDAGVQGLPTSLDSIASLAQSFVPVSENTEQATQTALALNNALIAGGAGADVQAAALEQFRQALAKGKPELEDWRALEVAMPAQLSQVAKALGLGSGEMAKYATNGQGLYDAMKDGKITMDDFNNAMINLNQNGLGGFPSFADQAKNASGGLQTTFTNMKTAVVRGIADIINSIGTDTINSAIKGIADAFTKLLLAVKAVVQFAKAHPNITAAIVGGAVAIGAIAKVATTIGKVTSAFKIMAPAVKVASGAMKALGVVMAANPMVIIVAAIAAIVAGLIYLQVKFNIFGDVINVIKAAWGGIVSWFSGIFSAIGDAIGAVVNVVMSVVGTIVSFLSPIIDFYKNAFILYIAIVTTVMQTIFNVIVTVVGAITNVIGAIIGFVSGVVGTIINVVVGFVQGVFGVLGAIGGWIWDNVISPVANFFSGLWNGVKDGVSGAVSGIRNVFSSIAGWINSNVVQPVARFFGGLWDGVKGGASASAGGVKSVFGSIGGFIKAPINGIIGAINKVIDTINGIKVPDWVPGIGGQHTNFGHIPKLATGGIITQPTVALVGESGREAVMPLENNTGWISELADELSRRGGVSGGTTINNNYDVYNEADVTLISREQARLMRRAV